MKRLVVIGIALIAGRSVFATVFPDADGSHDFTSAAAWGGASLPADAEFSGLTGTYNAATGDATFANLKVAGASDVTFDLLTTPLRAIGATSLISLSGSGAKVSFLGGTWTGGSAKNGFSIGSGSSDIVSVFSNATLSCAHLDFYGLRNRLVFTGKDAAVTPTSTDTYSIFEGKDCEFLLTDGAVWSHTGNHLYTTIGSAASNNVLRIANDARLVSTKVLYIGYNAKEGNNRVEVQDGGLLDAPTIEIQSKGQSLIVSNATVRSSNHVRVRGTDCLFSLRGEQAKYVFPFLPKDTFPFFNYAVTRGVIEVADGAVWEFSTNNLYTAINGAPVDLALRIRNGGKFLTTKNIYLGYSNSEVSNRIEVLSGGCLQAANIYLKQLGQALIVSNGTVSCTGSTGIRFDGGSNCRLVLTGPQATVQLAKMQNELFPAGHGHALIVSDGAKWAYDGNDGYYTSIASTPYENLVRVERDGELTVKKSFLFGYDKDHDNRLEVLNGGTLSAGSVSAGGVDNTLVVSNGTVTSKSQIHIGYAWGDNNTGLRCEIGGTNSQISATTYCHIRNKATVHFVVPPEGYAVTPITAGTYLNVADGTAITVDADAFQQGLKSRSSVVLAEWGTVQNTSISASVLAAANAELAEKRMQLVVEDKKLILKVRPIGVGMMILLR